MNEDINDKIKRLTEQMKRQQAATTWQNVTSKKGKKVAAETSAEKFYIEAKSSTEGKNKGLYRGKTLHRAKSISYKKCYFYRSIYSSYRTTKS